MILLRITLFFLILLLLPDWYIYKFYIKHSTKKWKRRIWWVPSIGLLLALLVFIFFRHSLQHAFSMYLIIALCIAVPKMVFMVCDTILYLCKKTAQCLFRTSAPLPLVRLYSLAKICLPLFASLATCAYIVFGAIFGKEFFQVKEVTFTSADVQFTYDKLKENASIYSSNLEHVTMLEIVDDYTVKIYLDQEVPFFEYYLTFPILSKTFYDTQDYYNTGIIPVGTGKYKVENVQENYITLTKNTNWWDRDTKLSLEDITVNVYDSIGELYNAFKLGNVDMVSTNNINIQDYIGTMGYSTKEIKGREHDFLVLNTQNTLLANQEVRRAIAYSIDKNNIVSNVFQNKYYTSSFPLDFGSWVYQEQDASSGYNPEQANQLLTENGWNYRSNYWQKTINSRTQRIELNLIVKASNSTQIAVAENIKTQLENQGIKINIQQYSDEQYNLALQNKSYDMILCSMNLSPNPDMSLFFGENNLANYSNEEITNLMSEVKNTTDEEIIKKDYARLAEIYKTDIPYISLYTNKHTIAYNTELVGEINSNWFNPFCGIETWYR